MEGLAAIVQEGFHLDPFAPALFVFCNRHHNKLKILHWEANGFWLYYRRLERGHFQLPATPTDTARELQWLLDGLAWEQREAHPPVRARFAL